MKFLKRRWIAIMTVLLLFSTSGFVQAAENTSSADTTKPVIKGVEDLKTVQGMPINLLKGVSAKDDTDGKLTDKISVSKVNFSKAGNQTIMYSVKDSAGNKAVKTATLKIVGVSEDEVKPAIHGYTNIVVNKGKEVNLLKGITAIDNRDGDLTDKIKVSKINFSKVGKQTLTYTVSDSAGNKQEASVKVIIFDNKITKCNVKKYVSVKKATVFKNTSRWSDLVKNLTYRSSVTVTGTIKGSDWIQVKLSDGTVGYAIGDFFSSKQPAKKNIEEVEGGIIEIDIDEKVWPESDSNYSDEQLELAGEIWAEEQGLTVSDIDYDRYFGIYLKVSDGYNYLPVNTKAGEIVSWDKGAKWKNSSDKSNEHGDTPPAPDTSDTGEGW
jgi:hypothetical protein